MPRLEEPPARMVSDTGMWLTIWTLLQPLSPGVRVKHEFLSTRCLPLRPPHTSTELARRVAE